MRTFQRTVQQILGLLLLIAENTKHIHIVFQARFRRQQKDWTLHPGHGLVGQWVQFRRNFTKEEAHRAMSLRKPRQHRKHMPKVSIVDGEIITWSSSLLSRGDHYHVMLTIITWSSSSRDRHQVITIIITWSSLSRDHHYHVIIKKRKCSWQFFFNSHYRKFLCLLFSFSLGTANQDRHTRNTATAVANHAPEREEEANSNSDYEGDEWGEEGWQEDEWSNERVSRYIHCWHNITLDIRFLYFA